MGGLAPDELEHEVVVKLTVYLRHDLRDVFAKQAVPFVAKSGIDVVAAVKHHSQVVADRVDSDDGGIFIFAELTLRDTHAPRPRLHYRAHFLFCLQRLLRVHPHAHQELQVKSGAIEVLRKYADNFAVLLSYFGLVVAVESGEIPEFGNRRVSFAQLIPVLEIVLCTELNQFF